MKTWVLRSGLLLVVGAMVLGIELVTVPAVSAIPVSSPSVEVSDLEAPASPGMDDFGGLLALLLSLPLVFGTTLAVDSVRPYEIGERNDFPVVASDIVYEGAAVGLVDASGHARPLTASDKFVGFCVKNVDNSAGAAAAKMVHVASIGKIQLAVSGAVITDVGQPVYATDDDTFVFNPVAGVFVGYVHRFVSSGVVIVEFNWKWADPYGSTARKLKSANYTIDATDNGTTIFVDTDAVVLTLPAVGGISGVKVVNIAAFGVSGVSVSPNAVDMIEGPGITAADDKDIINTKATARRGDYITIIDGDANGWSITEMKGTWARQA